MTSTEKKLGQQIYLSPPHLTDEAITYLRDAVDSNWIAPVGPHVDAFEQELAAVLGIKNVLLTNSGTSAIHLGLLALGVKPGDEVLCSTFTFCASVNPVIYCGASPVFIDSEEGTWNMDPALLEEAITDRIKITGRKPKAIIVVHLYGMPARMAEVMAVARKYDIRVLEDAAEALGALYNGKPAGALSDIGVLSFNGNKIITASGGGAVISNNDAFIERARYLRQEAREPLPYYEHREIGYNYRMSNLLAAVGRSQLRVLGARVARKREIFDFYVQELEKIQDIRFQQEAGGIQGNRWLSTIILPDKIDPGAIRASLEKQKIESRLLWKPMHQQPVFAGLPAYLNHISEGLFARGLCLPSGTALQSADLQRITSVIKEQFK